MNKVFLGEYVLDNYEINFFDMLLCKIKFIKLYFNMVYVFFFLFLFGNGMVDECC